VSQRIVQLLPGPMIMIMVWLPYGTGCAWGFVPFVVIPWPGPPGSGWTDPFRAGSWSERWM